VIIYHTMQLRSYPIELLILLLAGKLLKSQKLVMIHSERFIYRLNWVSRKLTGLILGCYDQLILVSEAQKQEIGARIELTGVKHVAIESPFLPPDFSTKLAILSKMPSSLNDFIQNHAPVISCIVTRKIDWQGQDLYGADLALGSFRRLKQDYSRAGLILVIGDKSGYEDLSENLKENPGVYLLVGWEQEVWPLIGETDLLIRPTRSDSFGISIMEALSLGVPVVASDVCVRPNGAILFKNGDEHDLYMKIKLVLRRQR